MKFGIHCPGQGSQSVGMLSGLADQYPCVKDVFSTASEVLDYDLWALVQHGPKDKLNQTEFTQPALLAAGFAVWQCWKAAQGPDPLLLAGHSLGEYTALVIAQSLSFPVAIDLVALRGRAMKEACPLGKGAMAAIVGIDENAVTAICKQASGLGVVSPANFNSMGQTVISGEVEAVEQALMLARRSGAKIAKHIPVSVASHCILMQPAADQLKEKLITVEIQRPKIPVIHNVDVRVHEEPEDIRHVLVQQLVSPVRWVDTVLNMENAGMAFFIECGPGKVLSGLNRRITKTVPTRSINTVSTLDEVIHFLHK